MEQNAETYLDTPAINQNLLCDPALERWNRDIRVCTLPPLSLGFTRCSTHNNRIQDARDNAYWFSLFTQRHYKIIKTAERRLMIELSAAKQAYQTVTMTIWGELRLQIS